MNACRWQIAILILILLIVAAFIPATQAKFATNELPRVESEEKLQSLLNENRNRFNYGATGMRESAVTQDSMDLLASNMKSAPSFSESNVQVAGVDEADIVKTDGNYLYQVRDQKVLIIQARPASELSVKSVISLPENPQALFIDDNRLVVIGSQYSEYCYMKDRQETTAADDVNIIQPVLCNNTLVITTYDTTDKHRPVKIDSFIMEGNYLSSRKIMDKIYIISTESVYTPYRPAYYINDTRIEKSYEQIRYFPDILHDTYLHIGTVSIYNRSQFELDTYLSSGSSIYCSADNLYVSAAEYKPDHYRISNNSQESTLLYKFNLKNGIKYQAQSSVPGTIINQFSMDEYNDYFRIATTINQWSDVGSENAVYILDQDLEEINSITGIAPGEKIYSTRFLAERLYMVTFKQIDPFFVIDLDPQNPQVLGKLKIPGFSKYLHPYNENLIIGLGHDTTLNKHGGVIQQGIKLSMFDVSDVTNPLEIDQEIIGIGGSSSEACENHLAFLLYNNLLAFPATVYDKNNAVNDPYYGTFDFQGAYIYEVSEQGFAKSGRITHLMDEDYIKAGDYWYDNSKSIRRIMVIDNKIYTISDNKIKVNERSTLKQINQLSTI